MRKNAERKEEGATGVGVCVEWGIGFGWPSRMTRDEGPGQRSDRVSQGQARAWQWEQLQRGHEQAHDGRGRNDYNDQNCRQHSQELVLPCCQLTFP